VVGGIHNAPAAAAVPVERDFEPVSRAAPGERNLEDAPLADRQRLKLLFQLVDAAGIVSALRLSV
jgi:hypothetical protein